MTPIASSLANGSNRGDRNIHGIDATSGPSSGMTVESVKRMRYTVDGGMVNESVLFSGSKILLSVISR